MINPTPEQQTAAAAFMTPLCDQMCTAMLDVFNTNTTPKTGLVDQIAFVLCPGVDDLPPEERQNLLDSIRASALRSVANVIFATFPNPA